MASTEKVLKARLVVSDEFGSTLAKFTQSLSNADKNFTKFANSLNGKVNTLEKSFNKLSNTLDNNVNKINNSLGKQANEGLTKSISTQLDKLQKKAQKTKASLEGLGKVKNSGSPFKNTNSNNSSSDNKGLKDLLNSQGIMRLMKGNYSSFISKMGIVGTALNGISTEIKFLNNQAQAGFDRLNAVTNNLFTADGLKNAINEAMGFESGREGLDVFYANLNKLGVTNLSGKDAYGIATRQAIETYASESDTIDIMKTLATTGVTVNNQQLRALLDVAATRPTVDTAHIGLALQSALNGNVAMIKRYGITNDTLRQYLDKLEKTDTKKYNNLKGAFSGKSIGNKQTYLNLFTEYVANDSPFGGYSERYAQNTLQGKLERFGGVLQKNIAEIVGMNTNEGKSYSGSLYSNFANFIDEFKDKMEGGSFNSAMDGLRKGLGRASESVFNVISSFLDYVDWNRVGEVFDKVGNSVGKTIDKIVNSKVFDNLVEMLPDYIEATLTWKQAVIEFKLALDYITGGAFTGFVESTNNRKEAIEKIKDGNFGDLTAKNMLGLIEKVSFPAKISSVVNNTVGNWLGINNSKNDKTLKDYFVPPSLSKAKEQQTLIESNTEEQPNRDFISKDSPIVINQQFEINNTEKVDENKLANNIFGMFANSLNTSFLNSSN